MELEAAPAPAIVEATVAAHVAVATAAASVVQTSVQEEQPPNSGATAKEKVGKKEKTGKDKEVGTGNKRSYDEPTEEEQSALQEELEVEMQRERKRAKKEKKKAGGGQQPVLLKLPPTIRKAAQAVMYSDEEEEEAKDASYTPKRETVKKLRAKLQTAREELGVLQAGRLAAEEEVPVAVAELHDAAKMNKKDMDAIASSNAATRIYEILLGLNSRAAAPVAQFLEKYVQANHSIAVKIAAKSEEIDNLKDEIALRKEETEAKRRETEWAKDHAAELAGHAAMERALAEKRKQRSSAGSVLN